MKRFFRKGSAEMVSIILGIVVIGGLALAVTGGFSQSSKRSFDSGLTKQTTDMRETYDISYSVENFGALNNPTDPWESPNPNPSSE